MSATVPAGPAKVVIVGGGYAGMNTARLLRSKTAENEADITVVDPRSYMTYQPFLAEAAAGSVEPRHMVVPLREVLPHCHVLSGEAIAVDREAGELSVRVADGHVRQLSYDVLVLAPGSVSKTVPVPGLADHASGFNNLGEAIYLRNHVLSRLDAAASTLDETTRERLLTFLFVGGGYAGVEAMAELADMAIAATRDYRTISQDDMRWVLVEAADRIMPEVSAHLAEHTLSVLSARGFETYLGTTLDSVESGVAKLSNGVHCVTDTVVWTAGVTPPPVVAQWGLPLDERGRIACDTTLQVRGQNNIFAAGDAASVPDISGKGGGNPCPPSAQHAARQARRLAYNIVALLRGTRLRQYKHAYAGSVASLGLYRGVAEIYGVRLTGVSAWALHRLYHLATMPTWHRKVRIAFDWLLSLPFRRQIVAMGELHEPRREFERTTDQDDQA